MQYTRPQKSYSSQNTQKKIPPSSLSWHTSNTHQGVLAKGLHKTSHRTQDCNTWQVVKQSPVWIWFCTSALFECIVVYHSLPPPLSWQGISVTMNPLSKEVTVVHPWFQRQTKTQSTSQNLGILKTKTYKRKLIMDSYSYNIIAYYYHLLNSVTSLLKKPFLASLNYPKYHTACCWLPYKNISDLNLHVKDKWPTEKYTVEPSLHHQFSISLLLQKEGFGTLSQTLILR